MPIANSLTLTPLNLAVMKWPNSCIRMMTTKIRSVSRMLIKICMVPPMGIALSYSDTGSGAASVFYKMLLATSARRINSLFIASYG